jgi:hypothetical protein
MPTSKRDLEALIIPGETAEDLARLTAEFHEKFNPVDVTERFLVDTLIHNEWRLRRMRRVEAVLWEQAFGKSPRFGTLTTTISSLDRLQRIIDGCQRNYHRALKELVNLRKARVKKGPQTIEPLDSSFQTIPTQ